MSLSSARLAAEGELLCGKIAELVFEGDCDQLAAAIIASVETGQTCLLVDFTLSCKDEWPAADMERSRALAAKLREYNAAIACVVPAPEHHVAVQCLYMHNAGACVLSVTDRREAIEWLHALPANDVERSNR